MFLSLSSFSSSVTTYNKYYDHNNKFTCDNFVYIRMSILVILNHISL